MGVLGVADVTVVVASLVVVFGVSLFVSFRSKRRDDAATEFFLAGRNSSWWLIAASLVASNIGTEHFIGQAGAGAYSGVVLCLYDWLAAYLVLALGWIFAPIYLKAKLVSIPEFLEGRFNKYCRALYVVILLVLYVLSKIGSSVYAGAVLMKVILGWSMWNSVPLIIISTALYTMGGGLKAVMYTDAIQLLIFVGGGLAGMITSFNLVGGMGGLFEKLDSVGQTEASHLFRPYDDRDYPWPAMVLSIPISGLAYWCVDQEMVQRVLAGKNLDEVRLGTSTAGLVKILPSFITVFPGMVARAMFEMCKRNPEDVRFADWCSADLDDSKSSDHAYPLLIANNFPTGIKGLMIASFLAAMMSSISSIFSAASTVFTYDIYERIFGPPGGSSPQRLTLVGRVLVVTLAGLTLAYLPVIQNMDRGLYVLACAALSHIAPPISAMFVAGIFIRRSNSQGATVGTIVGFVLGIVRFIVFVLFQHQCDADCDGQKQNLMLSNWFFCLNFNYFAVLLFAASLATTVAVSYFFPSPDEQVIQDYTFRFSYLAPEGHRKSSASCTTSHEPLLVDEASVPKGNESRSDVNLFKYVTAVILSLTAIAIVNTLLFILH